MTGSRALIKIQVNKKRSFETVNNQPSFPQIGWPIVIFPADLEYSRRLRGSQRSRPRPLVCPGKDPSFHRRSSCIARLELGIPSEMG